MLVQNGRRAQSSERRHCSRLVPTRVYFYYSFGSVFAAVYLYILSGGLEFGEARPAWTSAKLGRATFDVSPLTDFNFYAASGGGCLPSEMILLLFQQKKRPCISFYDD